MKEENSSENALLNFSTPEPSFYLTNEEPNMLRIRVYGKDGCKTCEKAKQKLEIMELPYEFVDITPTIEGTAKGENPNWRNDDSVMLMAAYQLYYTLPLIRFGDEDPVDYPEAMQRCREIEKARSPKQEVAPVEQELVLA